MSHLDTKRHDALFAKEAFAIPLHLIGVGGVGSHVAQQLGKLGTGTNPSNTIDVYDGDRIESHNVANQAYLPEHVGQQKTSALQEQFSVWSDGSTVHVHDMFVREHVPLCGIVFLCLDSMEARKRICELSIWNNTDVKLLIDTRMDAETAVCFAIDPNNKEHIEIWEERWFPDNQADNLAGCGGHLSVITAVTMTASIAVQQFLAFARNIPSPDRPNYIRLSLDTWELYTEYWDRELS